MINISQVSTSHKCVAIQLARMKKQQVRVNRSGAAKCWHLLAEFVARCLRWRQGSWERWWPKQGIVVAAVCGTRAVPCSQRFIEMTCHPGGGDSSASDCKLTSCNEMRKRAGKSVVEKYGEACKNRLHKSPVSQGNQKHPWGFFFACFFVDIIVCMGAFFCSAVINVFFPTIVMTIRIFLNDFEPRWAVTNWVRYGKAVVCRTLIGQLKTPLYMLCVNY